MTYYKQKNKSLITLLKNNIGQEFNEIVADLDYLANAGETIDLFDERGKIKDTARKKLTNDFFLFSQSKKLYDQIRIIDKNGMEVIRVNFTPRSPIIVPESQLQNKKGRYYFEEIYKLDKGKIYISPFDLNIEQGNIEIPFKPMLRIGRPLFNDRGEKTGIILFNYYGKILLKNFDYFNNMNCCAGMLVNSDGYWLKGLNEEDEWGFMFSDKKENTFNNKFPETWNIVSQNNDGQFLIEQGLVTYTTITPFENNRQIDPETGNPAVVLSPKNYYWKIILFIPDKFLDSVNNTTKRVLIYVLIFLGIVLAIVSWKLANLLYIRYQIEKIIDDEKKFRAYFEPGIVGMALTSPDHKWIMVNECLCKLLGYYDDELVGTNWINIFNKHDGVEIISLYNQVLQRKISHFTKDTRLITKNNTILHTLISFRGIFDQENQLVYGVILIQDITTRKRTEKLLKKTNIDLKKSREELRNYSSYLQSVREEERKKIAHEIHDELGQMLTLLKIKVHNIIHQLPDNQPDVSKEAQTIPESIDDLIDTVRRISTDLRPSIIDDFGVIAALQTFLTDFQNKTKIICNLNANISSIDVDQDTSIGIYRIIQESFTNIIRHSNATIVNIKILLLRNTLIIKIFDNGIGITNDQISNSKSLGLIGMRERSHYLGGNFKIKGKRNIGTMVKLSVPLKKEACNVKNFTHG